MTMERNTNMTGLFSFYSYEKTIKKMSEAAKAGDADASEDIQYLKSAMNAFHDYVLNVDMGETRIRIAMARYEGAELRETISAIDTSRRIAHEAAIAHASIINRYARVYCGDKIFTGDIEDRLQVADFCLEVTVKLFQERRM